MPKPAVEETIENKAAHRRHLLAFPITVLLLVAMSSNIYLTHLYREVHLNTGKKVDSFCAINEGINCVTVAESKYAALGQVPISLYAAEFFGLLALVVFVAQTKLVRLRYWDSVIFWALLVTLPISLLLAGISLFKIKSLCLMCTSVYGAHLIALLLLLFGHNRDGRSLLVRRGAKEVLKQITGSNAVQAVVTLVVIAGASQLFWAPKLFAKSTDSAIAAPTPHHWTGLTTRGMTVGPDTAVLKIEEFSDYQCPICARGHDIMAELVRKFPNQIQLRHRDYPLDQSCNRAMERPLHQHACRAAVYARCAANQQKFWPFASAMFANQDRLSEEELLVHAKTVGLNTQELSQCVQNPQVMNAVIQDIEEATRREVKGTPTFFVNGERIVGPQDLNFWTQKVQQAVAAK